MTERLDISVDRSPEGGLTARVEGEIDLANVQKLREALDGEPDRPLVVDLSHVTYIDSAGIAVLFDRAAHGPLEIRCRPDSVVAPLIDITRLGDVASIRRE